VNSRKDNKKTGFSSFSTQDNSRETPSLLAETSDYWIVDKPAGWLSVPAEKSYGKPLPVCSQWVSRHYGRPWIVHRLDVETSGLILFAKHAEGHRRCCMLFEDRQVSKYYLALVQGQLRFPETKITKPIEGKACLSLVTVVKTFKDASLVKIKLATGRRHQIRIHCQSIGHPLYGDHLYGKTTDDSETPVLRNEQFNRVALHSHRLEFSPHESYESPLPQDFLKWIEFFEKGT
jgi:RluA family pseudouridine synthase